MTGHAASRCRTAVRTRTPGRLRVAAGESWLVIAHSLTQISIDSAGCVKESGSANLAE
jgi:hypothetical protein